jgi:hypothetical protein
VKLRRHAQFSVPLGGKVKKRYKTSGDSSVRFFLGGMPCA